MITVRIQNRINDNNKKDMKETTKEKKTMAIIKNRVWNLNKILEIYLENNILIL